MYAPHAYIHHSRSHSLQHSTTSSYPGRHSTPGPAAPRSFSSPHPTTSRAPQPVLGPPTQERSTVIADPYYYVEQHPQTDPNHWAQVDAHYGSPYAAQGQPPMLSVQHFDYASNSRIPSAASYTYPPHYSVHMSHGIAQENAYAAAAAEVQASSSAKYECSYCGKGFTRPSSLKVRTAIVFVPVTYQLTEHLMQ